MASSKQPCKRTDGIALLLLSQYEPTGDSASIMQPVGTNRLSTNGVPPFTATHRIGRSECAC